jgi:hypothetical protein
MQSIEDAMDLEVDMHIKVDVQDMLGLQEAATTALGRITGLSFQDPSEDEIQQVCHLYRIGKSHF